MNQIICFVPDSCISTQEQSRSSYHALLLVLWNLSACVAYMARLTSNWKQGWLQGDFKTGLTNVWVITASRSRGRTGIGNREYGRGGSVYLQKLTLTSPKTGGRSVGTVRSRTKSTKFPFSPPPPHGAGKEEAYLSEEVHSKSVTHTHCLRSIMRRWPFSASISTVANSFRRSFTRWNVKLCTHSRLLQLVRSGGTWVASAVPVKVIRTVAGAWTRVGKMSLNEGGDAFEVVNLELNTIANTWEQHSSFLYSLCKAEEEHKRYVLWTDDKRKHVPLLLSVHV
jgi:hypothetical protein